MLGKYLSIENITLLKHCGNDVIQNGRHLGIVKNNLICILNCNLNCIL